MSVSINGTGGITFADASTQSTGGYTGFRNRIINGAMMIDQRNAGASVTPTNTGSSTYLLDRWKADISQASKFSVQQSSTAPAGFTNSLAVTSLSSYTVGSSEVFAITQIIEGYNVADLGWGAAGASSVTLSFWVRSSLTGTFGVVLENSANTRSYPATYTISAANTWEQKSITIAGDTSGTWVVNNGKGIQIKFGLGVGSTLSGAAGSWAGADYWGATGATSVVGTNGATFYITGVQLEKGSVATPFEFRPYGTELALCQRYCQIITRSSGSGAFAIGTRQSSAYLAMHLTYQQMRASPTWANAPTSWDSTGSPSATQACAWNFAASNYATISGAFSIINQLGANQGRLYYTSASGFSGSDGVVYSLAGGSDMLLTAEL